MPIILLALLIFPLLIVLVISVNIWLFHEGYLYNSWRCLAAAIALLAFNIYGRKIIGWLFSDTKREEPDLEGSHGSSYEAVQRPDGTTIHLEHGGRAEGDPVLLIHGWNATSAEWCYQREALAKTHRLLLMDLRGLGKSTRPKDNDYSLIKMAEDIETIISRINLKNVTLYGHSIGGMIILTYCTKVAKDLANIKCVILQHTTYTNPLRTAMFSKTLTALQKPLLEPMCHVIITLSPLFWLTRWLSYFNGTLLLATRYLMFTGTQSPGQLDLIARLSATASPAVFARGMLGMFRFDASADLNRITVPALVISGVSDRLTLPEAAFHLTKNLPNATQRQIDAAGHQGLTEQYHLTNLAVLDFLSRAGN